MSKQYWFIGASMVALACGGVGTPAMAQTAAPDNEGQQTQTSVPDSADIVVTAQRRSQRLQDVPVVVTAISAATLDQKGITTTADLSQLAAGITTFTANGFVMPSLRGVGSQINAAGTSGTVAIYLDGVYLASPQAALFGLNNIEQVEVDKGPQGTLFGRNATAGVIQIKTRDPSSSFEGRASAGIGNYLTATANLYLTGPIANNLAADIAIHGSYQDDGWGKNLYTGNDVYKSKDFSARSKLLWTPGADTRVLATADYSYVRDSLDTIQIHGIPYSFGIPNGPERLQSQLGDAWNTWSSTDPTEKGEQWGASLEIEHDFGGARLTNIVSYRRSDNDIVSPAAIAPYDAVAIQGHVYKQTSEELRLSSPTASKVAWVLGFYYLDSSATNEPYTFFNTGSTFTTAPCTARLCPPYNPRGALAQALGSIPVPADLGTFPANVSAFNTYVESEVGSKSYAGFAQATVPLDFIAPTFNLTGGIRWTTEEVSSTGTDRLRFPGVTVTQPDTRFSKLTYKAGIDYHFTPDVMGYVTYSRGFQAGFFNANTPRNPASKPQTIDDIEFGIKSTLFDRRLTLNLGGFHYSYTNIVANVVIAGVPNTTNGPKAELYGLDADLTANITDRLRLGISAEYLHSEFTSFPNATTALPASAATPNGLCGLILCNPLGGVVNRVIDATGNDLPYAPKFVITVSPSYRLPVGGGDVLVGGDWYHNSGYYNDASNTFRQNTYDTLGAYLEWRPGTADYSVRLWGKNLTNEAIYARMSTSAPFGEFYALAAPRTYGISVDVRF